MREVAMVLFSLVLVGCWSAPEGTRKGDCGDAKDNDKNGFTDCEDEGCSLDDECVRLAARAKLAEEAARAESAPPARDTGEDDSPYFELEKIWVQRGHNDADISQPDAKRYCENLTLAGKSDWRLPSSDEAQAVSNSKKIPLESLVMWTSTEKSKNRALIVGISTGAVNDLGLNSVGQCRARCVRDK
jgi:hypothetical protein